MTFRPFTALFAVALLAGCTASGGNGRPPTSSSSSASSSVPVTTVNLEPAVRYRPLPGEPEPEAKQAAADVLQAMTTFSAGPDPASAVATALGGLGAPVALVGEAAPLLVSGAASAGDIVYPQLGGLTGQAASVMVVLRQRLLEGGVLRSVVRTIDVRLARNGQAWIVTGIESVGGAPPDPAPPPSPIAAPVLANSKIDLPDSARWDIIAGTIDDRVLRVLAKLGTDHQLAITVLATGHPHEVFGSGHLSNHTGGRAVDLWAVDGRPVVEQRDPVGPLAVLARSLLADGVTELGGPWDLDGPGGASFTNTVHQDHLHVGFDR